MPGTTIAEDVEIIVNDAGGGGGGQEPPGVGGGGDDDKRRWPRRPSPRRYSTAVSLAIFSVFMFFMVPSSAFIVLKHISTVWQPVAWPHILWANTVVLLASSLTMELARRRLAKGNFAGFRNLWLATTGLGVLFLMGQLMAWRQLVAAGIYVATTQAGSFFYIFTAAHGIHLLAGICALVYVAVRNFEKAKISLASAAEITSHFWHFMDGLWIFIFALLYLGS